MTGSFQVSGSGLLVPGEARTNCSVCGDDIPKGQFMGHVRACARTHMDEIREEAVEVSKDLFEHDDERYQWLRQRATHGKA
jgi:hypothetical protein